MRKILLLAAAIVFSFFFLFNCSKDESKGQCGSKLQDIRFWIDRAMMENFDGLPYTYMDGNNRVFQWSLPVENVCPHEHVKMNAQVSLSSPASAVSARGRIDWLLFFERKFDMLRSGNEFSGNGDAGLKQAFGNDVASFFPVVEVYFPTKGSFGADSLFLVQQVNKVSYTADYHAFKP